ncbi:MAG TPA: carboxypeptidase regulatory-like domain-containing protein [Pyrinomonadaceae bacterium]|nr:carboxypeptidase regulatory-like domain-containing protein [Pyrinomonadaceae bacterium]
MKIQQKLVLCFVPLLILFSLATDALASCPMSQQGPPCQEYWRADAVFIGVANRVVNVPNDTYLGIGPYLRTTAYFTIEEAFKGVGGTGIVFDSSNCGYFFREGERYLVYAHRNSYRNNELEVIIGNTRTRPISEAVEDLKYIRGLSSAESGSRIFGKVAQHTFNIKESYNNVVESLQNITVILEGNNQRQEVVTDSDGRYEFKGLLEGTYRIRADVPSYLSYNEEIIKVNGRACVPLEIAARRKAQIAGRVIDSTGETLIHVPVSLVPADASHEEIFSEGKDKVPWPFHLTTLQGRFGFTQLPPGRYLLIINRTEYERSQGRQRDPALPRLFYPGVTDIGAATIIVVGKDDEPREYDFRLPIPE